MATLITHPYLLAMDPHEAELGRPYPPLATMVAAEVARRAGHEVAFHDPMFEATPDHFTNVLDGGSWDAVAILADDHSVQVKQCLEATRSAAMSMTAAARARGLPVLVSGPDVSDHPQAYLDAGAQAAAVGDPVEVLTAWLDGERDIAGLHGERGAGGRREVVRDLDRLPWPGWDLVDLEAYRSRWRRRHGVWEMNVWTARGCPYRCNWCAKPVWGRTYHVRAATDVAAEITALRERYQPDRLWFTDDIFALRPDWLRAFRAALPTPIPYRCLSRADLLRDEAYVDDLAATGCDEVWIGAESGADNVLRAMDKDTTVADIRRATMLLQGAGVRVGLFLQLGYPGESLADVLQTVDMVSDLKPDNIGVSVSYPLPGTAFHDHVSGSMTDPRWQVSMENRPLYQAPFDEPFYRAARELLRSTHSSTQLRRHVHSLLGDRDKRALRRVAGSVFHTVRRPVIARRVARLAVPNPDALPLTW